jgi:uncharacterized LabA/DUF88 family protein/Fe-S-cluster formation regulator IscX/YfhJ
MKNELKLAVLIDGDNVTHTNIKSMMEEIAKYGVPTFKRIYGDWTSPSLKGWKNVLLENAITPIQQYGYTTGKNSTDSAMIIDAMDILYSGKVDGFCLVSSDSDFTRLAIRLREAGMYVIGMGEKKTPEPFFAACDKFIYLEIIIKDEEPVKSKVADAKAPKKESISKIDNKLITLIASSIDDLADDDGWAFLGEVGNLILKKKPNFDPRNYGYLKLTPLIRSLNKFEIDERTTENKNIKHVFIRNK